VGAQVLLAGAHLSESASITLFGHEYRIKAEAKISPLMAANGTVHDPLEAHGARFGFTERNRSLERGIPIALGMQQSQNALTSKSLVDIRGVRSWKTTQGANKET
jgi:hypothetical protein